MSPNITDKVTGNFFVYMVTLYLGLAMVRK